LKRGSQHPHEKQRISQNALRAGLGVLFCTSLLVGGTVGGSAIDGVRSWWRAEPQSVVAIAVQGNRHLESRAVAAATGIEKGSRLSDIDLREVEAKLNQNPWIAAAKVRALPMGQLLVHIEEREAQAALRTLDEPIWRLVDGKGIPFATATESDLERLPRFRSSEPIQPLAASPTLVTAIELSDAVGRLGLSELTERAELIVPDPEARSNEGWVLAVGDPEVRIILGEDEVHDNLEQLARLMTSGLEELRDARRIDLRFTDLAVLSGASHSR
jgi:cell division protein FtsQ